jgi:manganese transport protein
MPHALFLHSWLTSKKLDKHTIEEKQKLRKLHLLENVIVLTVAAMVNAAIMIMSAAAFSADYSSVQTISDAYMILIPLFGTAAGIVFIITLLSSGISSSVVGTLAGQVIMEGLLGLKVNLWTR